MSPKLFKEKVISYLSFYLADVWGSVRNSVLFWAGLGVRLLFLFVGGSYFLKDLFIPFMDYAVQHPLANPWSQFDPVFFPYGGVLYSILFVPKFLGYLLFGKASLGTGPLGLALMKTPMLALDALLFLALRQFSTRSTRSLLLFYWANPVLIYITYIHGQLDVAAMTFVVVSLLLLIQGRVRLSGVFMGLATACKFHVMLVIPLVLVYLWKNDFFQIAYRRILRWTVYWGMVTAAGFLPVLMAGRFLYATLTSPQAGRVFGVQIPMGADQMLLLGFALLLFVLGRLCVSSRVTARGLVFGTGILFGVLLLIVAPMPGWYYWVFPFLCLFYATFFTNHPILFWALNGVFLIFFGSRDFLGPSAKLPFSAEIFALMQTLLAATLAEVWLLVIRREMPLLGSFRPILIGIAGDSGVGKNTLSLLLSDVFGKKNSVILEGDDYHRWERDQKEWELYTHLNPRANYLPTLADHTAELLDGRFIAHPHYDHETGSFTAPRTIKPSKTIIVQGLHALYLKEMRENFHLKIFMAPDELVRLSWKIKRDVKERGYSLDDVLKSLEKRQTDAQYHVKPQQAVSDWTIAYFPAKSITREEVCKGKEVELGVRYILWNDAPISRLVMELRNKGGCEVKMEDVPGDIDRTAVSVTGHPTTEQIQEIGGDIFPNLRQITRSRTVPTWRAGLQGVNQLMALLLIQAKGM